MNRVTNREAERKSRAQINDEENEVQKRLSQSKDS